MTKLDQQEFDTYSVHEQVIISATGWFDFLLLYREHVEAPKIPISLFEMFSTSIADHPARAFVRAEVVLSEMTQGFAALGDYDRAEFYYSLVVAWRNKLLIDLGVSAEYALEIEGLFLRHYDKYAVFDKDVDVGLVLRCAVQYDSFLMSIREMLGIKLFLRCMVN